MGWLHNEYMPNLEAAGLQVQLSTNLKMCIRKSRGTRSTRGKKKDEDKPVIPDRGQMKTRDGQSANLLSDFEYTDILCELDGLARVYWSTDDPAAINQAMLDFWKYLSQPERQADAGVLFELNGQQDTMEFMQWLFDMAATQMRQFCTGIETLEYVGRLPWRNIR
jgi:hypothetical protein